MGLFFLFAAVCFLISRKLGWTVLLLPPLAVLVAVVPDGFRYGVLAGIAAVLVVLIRQISVLVQQHRRTPDSPHWVALHRVAFGAQSPFPPP